MLGRVRKVIKTTLGYFSVVRWALVTYLVVVMAAGPSLCCCTFSRLVAAPPVATQADEKLPPCCQHSDRPAPAQGHRGCPGDEGDPKPSCSCRAELSKPAIVERAAELPDHGPDGLWVLAAALAATINRLPDGEGDTPTPWEPPPPLTAWGMLHLHHQLRC
jgi:hypothetical protein